MNIIHLTFNTLVGKIFAVAWFDANLSVYRMDWHRIEADGKIGDRLDYDHEVLEVPRLTVEKLLRDCAIEFVSPE